MALSTVLLDIDGTLIDSNDAHAKSWVEAFAAHGRQIAFDKVRPLIGKGGDKLLDELFHIDHESDEGKAISTTRKKIFKEKYLPQLKPFRQTRELLLRMKQDDLQLVVATSAEEDLVEALLDVARA